MATPDLTQIQAVETELLIKLKEVCEKYHITYFLTHGTLLGACRHQGFIPWDDDADVLIPAYEADRLVECFNKENDGTYVITSLKTEQHFPNAWLKIRKNNTTSMPKAMKELPIHWGICIDVFLFYGASKYDFVRKMDKKLFLFARKFPTASLVPYMTDVTGINRAIAKLPLGLRRKIFFFLVAIFGRLKNKETEYVYIGTSARIIKRNVLFGEEQFLPFHNEYFRVPAKTHEYLCALYGKDYMTPPPIEKRGGHDLVSGEIIWDCEKNYTEYQH